MSSRIFANKLKLKVDGVDYWADLSSVVLASEPASIDQTTFAEAAAGGAVDWYITVSGIVSLDAGSFWRTMWTNAGDEVAFEISPFGNSVPTGTAPIFEGLCRIPAQGSFSMGGEASADGSFSFSDVRFEAWDVNMAVS